MNIAQHCHGLLHEPVVMQEDCPPFFSPGRALSLTAAGALPWALTKRLLREDGALCLKLVSADCC